MGLQRFPISDFRGGLNTRDGPFALESNEAQDLLNVSLSRRGVLIERAGKTRFDTSGMPTVSPEHIRAWYPNNGNKFLFLSINGDIWRCTTAGAFTSLVDGTNAKTWHFEQGQDSAGVDKLWCMNGTDPAWKISNDGSTVTAWAGTPPNGTMMRLWRNIMVVSGVAATPQRVFFSDIGNPESPVTAYGTRWKDVKTTEDDADPVTWLEIIGDLLIVFKKQSTWVINDETTFAAKRLGAPGCEDRFQSGVIKNRAYFFNRNGVWSTEGVNAPRLESEKIENYITDNLNYSQLAKARVMPTRDRRLMVALAFGASTVNNRMLEFLPDLVAVKGVTDPRSGAWTVHDYFVDSFCSFRPSNVDVVMAGITGKLHTLFTGTTDDGAAYSAFWWTGWRSLISEEPFERIRRVNVEFAGKLIVETYKDFEAVPDHTGSVNAPADLDPFWDGGSWSGGTWDPMASVLLGTTRPESRGRYHSVRFFNADNANPFTIYAGELAFRGGKEH